MSPLRKGKSKAAISSNIRTLLQERPMMKQDQAVAIAMRTAGMEKKKKKMMKKK